MTDTLSTRLLHALERMPPLALGLGALVAIGAPIAGTTVTEGPGDVLLVALAVAATAGAAAITTHRRRLASLPLVLSPIALRATERGHAVYRFRARLGRGRVLRDVRCEVSFEPDGAPPVPLLTATPHLAAVVGPVTILADDPTGRCERPGRFRVRASGREGGRTWEVERTWPRADLRTGRFAPPASRRRGGLTLAPSWDAIEADG